MRFKNLTVFSAPSSHRGSATIGEVLDERYKIMRLLAEGGMGAVYLASHTQIGRLVAVKFLHAEFAAKEDAVQRFRREAQATAAIHHSNIIEVLDFGLSKYGEPYLVMEYLEGESLAALMKRAGPLSLATACAVIEPTLLALQAAHRKGIVHRDLKPDNLFLAYSPDEPPSVKVIDFGISKFTSGDWEQMHTKTGSVLGTPAYMSPEQARGLPSVDHRTDIYSVGTILYEMLTGSLPFHGKNASEYLANSLLEDPQPPNLVYSAFPIQAEPILRKALAKQPEMRFQSAIEFIEALRDLADREGGLVRLQNDAPANNRRSIAAGDLGDEIALSEKIQRQGKSTSRTFKVHAPIPWLRRWRWTLLMVLIPLVIAGIVVGISWNGRTNHPSPIPIVAPPPPQRIVTPLPLPATHMQNPPSPTPLPIPSKKVSPPSRAHNSPTKTTKLRELRGKSVRKKPLQVDMAEGFE